MTHIRQHLPIHIAAETPSRINTADGWAVNISWRKSTDENPYADGEEFAAFIVRAVNAHDELVKALEAARNALNKVHEIDGLLPDELPGLETANAVLAKVQS